MSHFLLYFLERYNFFFRLVFFFFFSVINQRPFKVRIWPEIPPAGVHQKGRNVCAIRTYVGT